MEALPPLIKGSDHHDRRALGEMPVRHGLPNRVSNNSNSSGAALREAEIQVLRTYQRQLAKIGRIGGLLEHEVGDVRP